MTREQHYYIVGVLTNQRVLVSEKISRAEREYHWAQADYYKRERKDIDQLVEYLVKEWDLSPTAIIC